MLKFLEMVDGNLHIETNQIPGQYGNEINLISVPQTVYDQMVFMNYVLTR